MSLLMRLAFRSGVAEADGGDVVLLISAADITTVGGLPGLICSYLGPAARTEGVAAAPKIREGLAYARRS